jgi:outer membrane receptor protein involved in Fe transport
MMARSLGQGNLCAFRVLLLSVTALVPAHAVAQDGERPAGSGEIIVTAQKREESLQDVPLSLAVLGEDELEDKNVNSFEDYARLLPSLTFETLGPGQAQVYFRGITNGNALATGSLPSVGIYLDEQPVTTIGQALDVHIYDVARVEALAGPQGTLYGASSEAGTLRIITNRPDPSGFDAGFDGTLQTILEDDFGGIAEGFANIPVSENVAVRLVGFYQDDPGYIDNPPSTDLVYPTSGVALDNTTIADDSINTNETYGGRAQLRGEFGDWAVTPAVMYQNLKARGSPAFRLSQGPLDNSRFFEESFTDEWVQAALTIEGRLGPLDLTYAGAWLDRKTQYITDYTDYSFFYDQYYMSDPDYFGNLFFDNGGNLIDPSQLLTGRQEYGKMSHELRISLPKSRGFEFVAGLFYQRQTNDWTNLYVVDGLADAQSVTGLPGVNYANIQNRIDRDYAAFAQGSYDISPSLTLTGGLRIYRYDNDVFGFFGYNADRSAVGEALCFASDRPLERGMPCINIDANADGSGVRHKLGLTWRATDDALVYATWSTGFRPGGINRRPIAPAYEAENLANYEIGWKTTLLGGKMRFNGAIFLEELTEAQFAVTSDQNGITDIVNAGGARSYGVEAQVDLEPTSGLTLTASGTLLNAELRTDLCTFANPEFDCTLPSPSGQENGLTAPAGTAFPYAPEFKATATARYEFALMGSDAHLRGTVAHQSSSFPSLDVTERELLGKLPRFTTVDLAAGIEGGSWSLELVAANLFDERGQISRFASCNVEVCTGAIQIIPVRPRQVSLRLGWRY